MKYSLDLNLPPKSQYILLDFKKEEEEIKGLTLKVINKDDEEALEKEIKFEDPIKVSFLSSDKAVIALNPVNRERKVNFEFKEAGSRLVVKGKISKEEFARLI